MTTHWAWSGAAGRGVHGGGGGHSTRVEKWRAKKGNGVGASTGYCYGLVQCRWPHYLIFISMTEATDIVRSGNYEMSRI